MMAPCKRQLKATRHLICGSCSNWVDFVKSGCDKSWAEVQADRFSFECRGCARMKELEVELEELRLLIVAMVGREQGSCASISGGGTVDDKVGKDTRDARESSPQPGRKLRGGKETGRKGTGGKTTRVKESGVAETGGKEKGVGETEGKTTGVKERGVGETRAKEWEVGETGGKGSGQNVMEGIERKSYSAAVIEGVRKRAREFVGDSIVRKTDRVLNKGDDVVVCLPGAKIEAITERNERDQVITTNMWMIQEWKDEGLQWDPVEYGGVKTLFVPSKSIWLPELVLYNNADGDYTVTIMTKATLSYYGTVHWEPPVIFKSFCEMEVEFFPFDIQHCHMKLGPWSDDRSQVDLLHIWQERFGLDEMALIDLAVDLSEFHRSVEWDLVNVPAKKNFVLYPCCESPYVDITFNLTLRRKTLFYTINLLIPCISINALTILGFYLPSDAGEKISLCISILLSLSIFQLLLMEIVPATSLTIPLMGKYILFTSILLSISIFSSVITLNVNFRSTSKPKMPRATRRIFLEILPRLLCMHRPNISSEEDPDTDDSFDWNLFVLHNGLSGSRHTMKLMKQTQRQKVLLLAESHRRMESTTTSSSRCGTS
ncbi:Acetylcholine receptor subunit alpha-like 1 [Lamellibrachia satsuma]|nr:Acetylcholine receptor subunit alpha-like 1 [Lamellibrachia satsuma]